MFTKSLWPVRRFYAVARPECDQMDYSALCLSTLENAKSIIANFRKSQTSIFSKMVKIWLLNGKVSLISIKLYLKVVSYHLSKNWKNTTTFALFLKVCLTQKRTETKHSTQNRAKALLLDFFPQKVLIESQLSRSVSVYILSVHLLIILSWVFGWWNWVWIIDWEVDWPMKCYDVKMQSYDWSMKKCSGQDRSTLILISLI